MNEHTSRSFNLSSETFESAQYFEELPHVGAIGSDFETAGIGAEGSKGEALPWDIVGTSLEYVQTCRQALAAIASYLNEREFDRIIFPGHYCESMISPFRDGNFDIILVPVKDSIRMDLGKTWEQAQKFPGRTVVFGMLYFGELPDPEYSEFVSSLSASRIPFVEDETHRLFRPGGVEADFTVGSLRKLLPVADGAYIRHKEPNNVVRGITNNRFGELRWQAMDSKAKNDLDFLEKMTKANELLETGLGATNMTRRSYATINSLDYEKLSGQRTANAKSLVSKLIDLGIPTLERDWEQITPSHLVVKTNAATHLQRQLAQHQVYCPIHWSAPTSEQSQHKWKDNLISIPIDHRYGDSDMERVANVLRKEWKE